eukprot:677887-Rhodomonas_salina.1
MIVLSWDFKFKLATQCSVHLRPGIPKKYPGPPPRPPAGGLVFKFTAGVQVELEHSYQGPGTRGTRPAAAGSGNSVCCQ